MGRRGSRHGQGDLATVGVHVAHADRVELVDVLVAVVESDDEAAAVCVETGNETTRNGRRASVLLLMSNETFALERPFFVEHGLTPSIWHHTHSSTRFWLEILSTRHSCNSSSSAPAVFF